MLWEQVVEELDILRTHSDGLMMRALLQESFFWPLGCYTTSIARKMIPLLLHSETFVQYLPGQQIFIACWSVQKGILRSWIHLVTHDWEQVKLKGEELHNTITWMRPTVSCIHQKQRKKIGREKGGKTMNRFPKSRWNFYCVKSSLNQGRVLPQWRERFWMKDPWQQKQISSTST